MNFSDGDRITTQEKVIRVACSSHCGGRCLLRVHVRDGAIVRIETDDGAEPQLRACLRCRTYRQRVYDPARLKFPLKRIGQRGEGKFERISWDEALDTVAAELTRVRETYSPSAALYLGGGGDLNYLHNYTLFQELLAMSGGCTRRWGDHSVEGGLFASMVTYGVRSWYTGSDDIVNSRLIIMWGWDPASTIQTTNTCDYLRQARDSGAKIISVDPRYTDTAATFTSRWIPIVPGTDTAMLVAMANVIITENLQEQSFLDQHTVGFEAFKNYVLGSEDGIEKTPAWAESITGVPATTTVNLAREYATTKPAALITGMAAGRTAYGEEYHRAAHCLFAMTGNIGVRGGWSGRFYGMKSGGDAFTFGHPPRSRGNPVESGCPPRPNSLAIEPNSDSSARIHFSDIADAILEGKAGGHPADIKMLLVFATNPVNQFGNTNKMVRALKELEFIVVAEQLMSATAKFADILLPVSTFMERNDVTMGGAVPLYGYVNQVIKPLGESRSPFEICLGLSERLGIKIYGEKTEEEWLKDGVEGSSIPAYGDFKRQALYRVPLPEPLIGFKEQIEDPKHHHFPTASGKIELYSQQLADMNNPEIPAVPKYIEPWEGRGDPLAAKYPLQLITSHSKRRAHSQFDRVPWLRELIPQALLVNTLDAGSRGVNDDDLVRVFNDRGEIIVPVRITGRIMPGVVDLPQGAWYDPDEHGIDRGGCANVLTKDAQSPIGAACHNTGLVQIEKVP